MLKKAFTLIFFLFMTSCGYEAIHSIKNSINYDFSISELTFVGDRKINLKIKEKLNNYTLNEKGKNFILKISSVVEKIVLAKNISGDPTDFKSTVTVNIEVLNKNNLQLGAFVYVVLVFLPLLPGGAFFNNYVATLFWINMSIMFVTSKDNNISK